MTKLLSVLLIVSSLLLISNYAFADHSFKDVLDRSGNWGANLWQAVHNIKKTKGQDTVCDFKNSVQIPFPNAANPVNTWRQIILCYENDDALTRAHEWLAENPLKRYGLASTYGLPVSATMDIIYVTNDDGLIDNVISFHWQ